VTGDVTTVGYDGVEVGTTLPEQRFPVRRIDLVRYAGASGDFNVIHWNERVARSFGLPDVIAHGMLTMAEAGRVLTDWVGDPAAVEEYGVRFSRLVIVPDDDTGAELAVSGRVVEKLGDKRVRVELTARASSAVQDGDKVLAQARAVVRLP
jgi:acyl dehydratase